VGEQVLAVCNGASVPQDIVDVFGAAGITSAIAQRIINARALLPGHKFSSVAQIDTAAGGLTGRLMLKYEPRVSWTNRPALLLPMRLETRFIGNELLVRIYPDLVSINSHDPRFTQAELAAGRTYLNAPADPEDPKAAWRELARQFGPERAAWIVIELRRLGPGRVPLLKPETEGWFHAPRVDALPRQFCVYLYRGNARVRDPILGRVISTPLTMLSSPDATGLFEGSAKWVADFTAAEEAGMAVRVPDLTPQDKAEGFSRVVVVGLRAGGAAAGQTVVQALIDAHHYTNGLAFLRYGTPTNNTQQAKSGHSESTEDREGSYRVELEGPAWPPPADNTNAGRLGVALGLGPAPEALRYLDRAGDDEDAYAADLQTALWPATGDYLLRHLAPGIVPAAQLGRLAQHFAQNVRGAGPLPAIRIGDQPYGVLPAMKLNGWVAAADDNDGLAEGVAFDQGLHGALTGLRARWLAWALDRQRVPKVSPGGADPDKVLLEILSMQPAATSYRVRPFVDERFVGWLLMALRGHAFGPGAPYAELDASPLRWAQRWTDQWRKMRREQARRWEAWTGVDETSLAAAPLLRLTGWWLARDLWLDLGVPLVETAEDLPKNYVPGLLGTTPVASATLLFDLLQRSLALAPQTAAGLAPVRDAIGRLGARLNDPQGRPLDLERLLRDAHDTSHNRLDAWFTSLATKRLRAMRKAAHTGVHVGAFGYVEDLKPRAQPASAGYVHAPSQAQAAAAAVLHNAYLTHADGAGANPFRISLTSERARRGSRLLEGLRHGQPLGALLGYQFERQLHEREHDEYIDDFRAAFPLVANKETAAADGESVVAMAARNVVDGLSLARWADNVPTSEITTGGDAALSKAAAHRALPEVDNAIKRVQGSRDAVSDVLMYEGAYQAVQGNFERASAAIEAASGQGSPPELESLATPARAKSIGHRVCLLLRDATAAEGAGPRALLDPRLAAWAHDLLGSLAQIGCGYTVATPPSAGDLGLDELGIEALDLIGMAGSTLEGTDTEIEARIRNFVRTKLALSPDTPVALERARPAGYEYGLHEALELARQMLDVLGAGSPLRPDSLSLVSELALSRFSAQDVQEMVERFDNAVKEVEGLNGLSAQLRAAADAPERNRLLHKASRYGLPAAIPRSADDPQLANLCIAAATELDKRAAAARAIGGSHGETPSAERRIKLLVDAARALFGGSTFVLPAFDPPNRAALAETFGREQLLLGPGHDEQRVRLWLQQLARVKKPLAQLEDLLMMAEGWRQGASSPMALKLAQLPSAQAGRWFGLDDTERGVELHGESARGRGVASIVAATNDPSGTLPSSLLLAQWDEQVPSGQVDTSVAFQFDAPGTQAPQTLLLAVPSRRAPGVQWSTDELAEIVAETMDLAKIRAVDADAMGERAATDEDGVGAVLPALMLPADPSKPGWARTVFADGLQGWLHKLLQYDIQFNFPPSPAFQPVGTQLTDAGSGLVFTDISGGTLHMGGYYHQVSLSAWDWRRILISSGAGIRVDLPRSTMRADVVAGWTDEANHAITVYDPSLRVLEAEERVLSGSARKVRLTLSGAETNYQFWTHQISAADIKRLEVRGPCAVALVNTFKEL
jgi:hypothetical protein